MWRSIGWIVVSSLALIGMIWLFLHITMNDEYARICIETCGENNVSQATAFHCKCRETVIGE